MFLRVSSKEVLVTSVTSCKSENQSLLIASEKRIINDQESSLIINRDNDGGVSSCLQYRDVGLSLIHI